MPTDKAPALKLTHASRCLFLSLQTLGNHNLPPEGWKLATPTPNALKWSFSGRLVVQKASAELARLPALPECGWGSAAPLREAWVSSHLCRALPAHSQHWGGACFRITCMWWGAALLPSPLPRTHTASAPNSHPVPLSSTQLTPAMAGHACAPLTAPGWPHRHHLSVSFPKRGPDTCILTLQNISKLTKINVR